ncbi:MAG: sporulation protein YpjB [Paenibacillaceae bacterium]|jgi:sporulation protein YpjB|nr:sporulation protein YpjB [Paenibacillaceae bacterium]
MEFMVRHLRVGAAGLACLVCLMLAVAGCGKAPVVPGKAPKVAATDQSAGGIAKADKEQRQKLSLLNETADKMYRYATEGNVLEARNQLIAIGDQVTRIRFDSIATVEGLNALTELLTDAKRTYNAVQSSDEQRQWAAARIRLAADALTHPNEPMWKQYGKLIFNDLSKMEAAVGNYDKTAIQAPWADLQQHYATVRPSLLLCLTPDQVERSDSLFTYLRNQLQAEELQSAELQTGLTELRATFAPIFGVDDAAAFMPDLGRKQPLVWSLSIGSSIVIVLAYTAWRMFGDQMRIAWVGRKRD